MTNADFFDRIVKCSGMLVATGTAEMATDLHTWAAAQYIEVVETRLEGGTHLCYRAAIPSSWVISLVVEVPRCH